MIRFKIAFFLSALVFAEFGFAEKIQLSEDELAAESVLPVFDRPQAVKARNIVLSKKFEVGLLAGASLNEPFENPLNVGGAINYNFSEEGALHVSVNVWMEGDSSFKQQLQSDGLIFLDGRPRLEYLALVSYQFSPYYGKISLSKKGVSNFHLFFTAGGGLATIGGVINPVATIGLGQKFYIFNSLALRFDLKGLVYNGPDPLSLEINEGDEIPDTSTFAKRIYINSIFNASLVLLL